MNTAIILAAGKGKRMKAKENKIFARLERTIIEHSIEAFQKHKMIDEIVIVCSEQDEEKMEKLCEDFDKVKRIVIGGKTRQQSSYNGVFSCDSSDIILIHDAARPFLKQDTITDSIKDADKNGASVVGVPVKDTIKVVREGQVVKTFDRDLLYAVQTPQTFRSDLIKKAHEKAIDDGFLGTDDTSLVERLGLKVKLTKGHYDNIKITTPDDLVIARKILDTSQ